MKKQLIVFPLFSFFAILIVSFGFSVRQKKVVKHLNSLKGFAVVELFTSEGCSSCPPADEAVAKLAKDYPQNVFVLCFHVDYWNYLGWKDAFSDAAYGKRQEQYASEFNLGSIYTPQAVVNGEIQFTGSDKDKLYSNVEKKLNSNNSAVIELSAKSVNANEVSVSYKTIEDNNLALCIALVQTEAETDVKRGENKGLLLHHINVVRNFKTTDSKTGATTISIPAGVKPADIKIIAFLQRRSDLHIIGAVLSPVN